MTSGSNRHNTNDIPREIEDQLALFFDNQATPEVCHVIHDWLEEDPNHAALFAEYCAIERMIYCAQKKEDASAVFGLLAELEASAKADTVTLVGELPIHHAEDPASLSAHDYAAVGGYVLRKTLSNKTVITVGICSAAAAALMLALILINPFGNEGYTPIAGQNLWDDADTPQPETLVPLSPTVATLTASNDAIWDTPFGTLAPSTGNALRPGDRLTLIAGFAEITTNDGAVAVLEGPSSVELIKSPNALILHTGKLVGICETESSKGFLVRTRSIDVTDLGTRFGVAVDQAGASLVQVFDGIVSTKPSVKDDGTSKTRELAAGQSLAIDVRGQEREVDQSDAKAFARLAAHIGGVAQLTGDLIWSDADTYIGTAPTNWPVQSKAVLIPEHTGLTLTKPILISSLVYDSDEQSEVVLPGTTIRTYILLFNPGGPLPAMAEGSVTFEGEVLGVVLHDNWNASLAALKSDPEIELFDVDQRAGTIELYDYDQIDLHPDTHTLAFKLKAAIACDAMRIVVREPTGESN